VACLDAYESTADLSYFQFAHEIANTMLELFFDPIDGGFLDTARRSEGKDLGVLGAPRKPFQDSPTPAGNPVAAIALLRLHAYTNEQTYRQKAERTLEIVAAVAGQYGLFAATYGIAGVLLSEPKIDVVVIGSGKLAEELCREAVKPYSARKTVLSLDFEKAVPQNLPPALGQSIPQIPSVNEKKTSAVICSDFSCQPPIYDPEQLSLSLQRALRGK
ncbi:MAG: thioredoxin domain-containing protein, partial [Acidobacteriaceae bacterium]|nr:thioredoxin domain-containing protein [Acidobacteriaceae bacterium]